MKENKTETVIRQVIGMYIARKSFTLIKRFTSLSIALRNSGLNFSLSLTTSGPT